MLWESLTAANFKKAVTNSGGVCVLPIGVIEKHGNHLPLGTDMFVATQVATAAAAKEKAIVFPYYFFGQIAEAVHVPGTISISHKLMMEVLREICDEIARNGLKKILILNSHGGNNHFLSFFAQEQPRLNSDYCVYVKNVSSYTEEKRKQLATEVGKENWGEHAGFAETSIIMHLLPELVHPSDQTMDECKNQNRLPAMAKHSIFTGFNWYANFPNHFAGDFTDASAAVGKLLFNAAVDDVAEAIKAIKDDKVSPSLVQEYVKF